MKKLEIYKRLYQLEKKENIILWKALNKVNKEIIELKQELNEEWDYTA